MEILIRGPEGARSVGPGFVRQRSAHSLLHTSYDWNPMHNNKKIKRCADCGTDFTPSLLRSRSLLNATQRVELFFCNRLCRSRFKQRNSIRTYDRQP